MTTLTAVDCFAGCGGLSKGFQNAGISILAAFENWDLAADCYELNFDHPVHRIDLNDVQQAVALIGQYKPDMIIGGPPCQDFSHAGKRIESSRASLTESFAHIVTEIRPKYFLMENVDRAQKSMAYQNARAIFKEAGYGITERVLMASYCGVPQRRKRFFCFGILGGVDGAIDSYLTANLSEKEMTMRDYFGDSLDVDYYYRHPRNYNRRGIFSMDEPAPTMRGVNRPVPKGYPGHPNDACKVSPDLRPLTTLERSLVQTFPSDYVWTGSKTDREQMVGNAVPVNLAKFVAQGLLDYLSDCSTVDLEKESARFVNWLQEEKQLSERSAKDVLSRIQRANAMVELEYPLDVSLYSFKLTQCESYSVLSSSVKSQIKRAVKLWSEFIASKYVASKN